MTSLASYLLDLERRRAPEELEGHLLWPRTPLDPDEYQARIAQRVGVSDREAANPHSRPARVARLVGWLVDAACIPPDFALVDIACGDGLVMLEVQRRFQASECYGVDLNADVFPAHSEIRAAGGSLACVLIQDLFGEAPPRRYDVVLMLNTYRGWESADLPERDRDLPRQADEWLAQHGRYLVLTAKPSQLSPWRERGFRVTDLGVGEDDARLVCVTRERLPRRVAIRAFRDRMRNRSHRSA